MLGCSTLEIGDNALVLSLALIPTVPAIIAAVVAIRGNKQISTQLTNGNRSPESPSMHDKLDKVYRTVAAADRTGDTEPHLTIDKKGN